MIDDGGGGVLQTGELITFKCILCHFTYILALDVSVFLIQIV